MVLELKLKINSTKMQIFNFFFVFLTIFQKMEKNNFNIYELAENFFIKFMYCFSNQAITLQLIYRGDPHVGFRDLKSQINNSEIICK